MLAERFCDNLLKIYTNKQHSSEVVKNSLSLNYFKHDNNSYLKTKISQVNQDRQCRDENINFKKSF